MSLAPPTLATVMERCLDTSAVQGSLQAGWVRCTQKSCLHPSPPRAGMGGSGLGSWSCLGPNEALSCVNLPEEHSLWGTTPDAGTSQGLA